MSRYYSFISGLPQLKWMQPPPFSIESWLELINEYLTVEDRTGFEDLLRLYDIKNLICIKRGVKPISPKGKYTYQEIEDALKKPMLIDDFFTDFIIQEETQSSIISLYSKYYKEVIEHTSVDLLREYFLLELAMMRLQARLQFKEEIPQGDILFNKISPHQARISEIYQDEESNPLKINENYNEILFDFISEAIACKHWGIEIIIAYHIQLSILVNLQRIEQADMENLISSTIDPIAEKYDLFN